MATDKNLNIYVLYTCDIWKSTASMHTEFVGTSEAALFHHIIKCVRKGYMDFTMCYKGTPHYEQAERLMWDILHTKETKEKDKVGFVAQHLDFGVIEIWGNNTSI